MVPKVRFSVLNGLSYKEVWDIQTSIHNELIATKLLKRELTREKQMLKDQKHQLIFCEHLPVYTLGKSGSIDHLLLSEEEIKTSNIEFFKINRGGDITYHGPGQITGYPIFDLDEFITDVHLFVRNIEEVIIRYLQRHNLEGVRLPKYTGVWIPPDGKSEKFRKICAIGVHLSRWVSMHGFAFNINTDLSYFEKIIPCGIADDNKTVTSLAKELGRPITVDNVSIDVASIFSEVFNFELIRI